MTRFDPPPARPLPLGRRDAMQQQLETLVGAGTGDGRRRGRKPVLIAAGAAAIVVGTTAGAIVYVQHSQPVTNKSVARCYTEANLGGGDQFHGTTIAEAGVPGSRAPQVDNAVSVCADLWRQGFLLPGAAGVARQPNTKAHHLVPPLVACVMPDGTAAVFPGNPRTCASLGLPRATGQ
jgi:hypothetical protein